MGLCPLCCWFDNCLGNDVGNDTDSQQLVGPENNDVIAQVCVTQPLPGNNDVSSEICTQPLPGNNDFSTKICVTRPLPGNNYVSTEICTQPLPGNNDFSTKICVTRPLPESNYVTELSVTQPLPGNNDVSTGTCFTQPLLNQDTSSILGLNNDLQMWFPKQYTVWDADDSYKYFSCDFKKWLKNDKLTIEPALVKYSYNYNDLDDRSNPYQEYELYATKIQSLVDTEPTVQEGTKNDVKSYSSVIQNDNTKRNISNNEYRTIEKNSQSFRNIYMRCVSILHFPEKGYIINENGHLFARNWHTLIGSDKKQYCMLCDCPSVGNHRANSHHKVMLEYSKNKILYDFGCGIVREIIENELYHCGVCNDSVNIDGLLTHVNAKQHLDNINTSKVRCKAYYDYVKAGNQNLNAQNNTVAVIHASGASNQNTVTVTSPTNVKQQNTAAIASLSNIKQLKPVAVAPLQVKQQNTAAVTSTSNAKQQNAATVTSNKKVKQQNAAAVTSAANVKQQNTAATTSTANVKQQNAVATTSTANVKQQNTVAVTSNKKVKQQNTASVTSTANVTQQNAAAVTTAANVKQLYTAAVTSTANVKQQNAVATTSTANVKQQNAVAVTSNKKVKQQNTASVTSTTNVTQQNAASVTTAANVKQLYTAAVISTANVKRQNTVTAAPSAKIKPQTAVAVAPVHKNNNNLTKKHRQLIVSVLKVKDNGFIINRKCHISSASWNATGKSNNKQYPKKCYACNIPSSVAHISTKQHKDSLEKSKFILEYKLNLIRQLPTGSYHCAICPFVCENVSILEDHIKGSTHVDNFKLARQIADDIMRNEPRSAVPWIT